VNNATIFSGFAVFWSNAELAAQSRANSRLRITKRPSSERMPVGDWQSAERLLAKLIARAFAADNPQLFGPRLHEVLGKKNVSGSPTTARADAVAPAVTGGDPENWSMENNGEQSIHQVRAA